MEKKIKSLTPKMHRHNYIEQGNFLVCECGKKILNLKPTKKDDLLIGERKDGTKYSVRTDRRRYFYPHEWNEFISKVQNKEHRFLFLTLLHTGARIMEALNLKYKDIDIERGTVKFNVVKHRVAKKNVYATGKSRDFFVASNYIKEFKSFIRNRKINMNDYIFLNNDKLPENYDKLSNKEKSKYYRSKISNYHTLLKNTLKKTNIKDPHNFSLHNIRKTYGMWMRIFDIQVSEMCYRLGHDVDTYLAHYGSSLIFTPDEKRQIQKIMGEVK